MTNPAASNARRLVTRSDSDVDDHLFMGSKETVDMLWSKARAKALRAGRTVLNPDGSKVWRERRVIYDANWRPVFRSDGERVLCQWVEITQTEDGETTSRNLRRSWVGYDAAHEGI